MEKEVLTTHIHLGSGETHYTSTHKFAFQPPKRLDDHLDVMDPYKSHTSLGWTGCEGKTNYSTQSLASQPFPGC